jgi:hypothetical protein
MQRLPPTMIRYPTKSVNGVPLRMRQARGYVPSLSVVTSPTFKAKTGHASQPIRGFHSTRDFADYMKQVMSPMTGREGEQTPSEESNTLREIDRLFTIISSKYLLISSRTASYLITTVHPSSEKACQKSSTTHPLVMLGRRSGPWLDASAVEENGNGNGGRQQRVEAGTRVMADSFTVAVLPFSTDKDLVEKYKNPRGGLSE